MVRRLEIEIYGRVQSVSFRTACFQLAKMLSIKGKISNEDDGSVRCIAQAEEKILEHFLTKIQKLAFPIKITGLKYEWSDELDNQLTDFKIIRNGNIFEDGIQALSKLSKRLLNPNEKIKVPNHVVIIPDGNRRWARERSWKPWVGHKKALSNDRVLSFLDKAINFKIGYLTLWGFSTENWDRDDSELNVLWQVFRENIREWGSIFQTKNVRFKHIGRKDRLPPDIVSSMQELEALTKKNSIIQFTLCLDYGGKDEILRAINKLKPNNKEIKEEDFRELLDTKDMPDPDLIIRTAGEKRTSGILSFQSAYAELYFTDVYFPDFDGNDFDLAILDYSARIRRFGGTHANDLQGIDEKKLIDPTALQTKL